MNRALRFLENTWFPPTPAHRLALLRIAIGVFTFWYLADRYTRFLRIARSDERLFAPVGLASWMGEPISEQVFELILIGLLVLNVLFVLGVRFRYVGPLFGVALMWFFCYRNSWSMIYHTTNLLVMHVLTLGITPAANAWSFDSLTRKSCNRLLCVHGTWPLTKSETDWRYGWPIQLMCFMTISGYWLSGMAKVLDPLGWSWASGEALQSYILRDGIRKELMGYGAPWLTWELQDQTAILGVLAGFTLLLELGAPLVLLHRRAGQLWSLAAFGMHWGIFFVMGITFRYQMYGVAFLPFFALGSYEPLLGLLRGKTRFRRKLEPELQEQI